MSHYTVVVIGDDVEGQLAPLDENISVEPYKVKWEDDELKRFLEHYKLDLDAASSQSADFVLSKMQEWNGNENVFEENEFFHVSTYNPKSKWDWYTIGGRWSGFFTLKNGGVKADQAMKGAIDFEGMKVEAIREAHEAYTAYEKAIAGTPEPDTWESVREKHGEGGLDAAREEFHAQPRVKALQAADLMPWGGEIEEAWGTSRESYVQKIADAVAVPRAILRNGEWLERGRMGWFAISIGDIPESEWNAKVQEIYAAVDDHTTLTLVDCHI